MNKKNSKDAKEKPANCVNIVTILWCECDDV